jgi:hypothetical protein
MIPVQPDSANIANITGDFLKLTSPNADKKHVIFQNLQYQSIPDIRE